MNVPVAVGVPLMMIVLLLQVAFNPAGNPLGVPIPVAPPVVMLILGERATFRQVIRGDGVVAVLLATTVMVPVAFTVPQPPVSGIV